MVCAVVFFFFKQKTAYELRISDWSSDVCSSDLIRGKDPLAIKAAVAIDAPVDLAHWGRDVEVCGQPVIAPLFGGTPADKPERYRQGSPMQMLPVGASVYLVRAMLLTESEAAAYETKARLAGDRVMVVSVAGANHRSEEQTSELQSLMRN